MGGNKDLDNLPRPTIQDHEQTAAFHPEFFWSKAWGGIGSYLLPVGVMRITSDYGVLFHVQRPINKITTGTHLTQTQSVRDGCVYIGTLYSF